MKAIKQRPFAFSCCLFMLASVLLFFVGNVIRIPLLITLSAIFTAFLIFRRKSSFIIRYLLPPLLMAVTLSLFFFGIRYKNIMSYNDKECTADFVITDVYKTQSGTISYTVNLRSINGQKVSFNALWYSDDIDEKPTFSSYSATVKLYELTNSDGLTSQSFSHISKNVYLTMNTVDDLTDHNTIVKLFPSYYFKRANSYLSQLIEKYTDGDAAALAQALLLGNRSNLSQKHSYNFRRLGLSHILAVSGMHLSLIIGSLDKLFEYCNIGKKKKHVILILMTFAYAGLTGFSPSVSRAAFMLILYYSTFLISKAHDGITALCFAAATLCFISPGSIFDIGLWLSFFSTYGILAAASPLSKIIKQKTEKTNSAPSKAFLKLLSALIFGTIPIMFSLPIVWISYGETAVLSPITNILFTPFVEAIMYTVPLVLLLSFLPPAAEFAAAIPTILSKLMLGFSANLAKAAPVVSINYGFTVFIIIFVVISYLIISLTNTKRHTVYFIPFLCGLIAFTVCASVSASKSKSNTELIYVNTFSGDAFVVISNNKGLICDVSGTSYANAKKCKYQLSSYHIPDPEAYIVTDYHVKGLSALEALLSVTSFKTIYLPSADTKDEKLLEQKHTEFAETNGLKVISYDFDDNSQISFYGMNIDIKKLAENEVNSPDAFCIKFSSDKKTLVYVSKGTYTTSAGKSTLTKLFDQDLPMLFGSYGTDSLIPITSLKYKQSPKIYFPSELLHNFYKNTLPRDADITITDENFVFHFN